MLHKTSRFAFLSFNGQNAFSTLMGILRHFRFLHSLRFSNPSHQFAVQIALVFVFALHVLWRTCRYRGACVSFSFSFIASPSRPGSIVRAKTSRRFVQFFGRRTYIVRLSVRISNCQALWLSFGRMRSRTCRCALG